MVLVVGLVAVIIPLAVIGASDLWFKFRSDNDAEQSFTKTVSAFDQCPNGQRHIDAEYFFGDQGITEENVKYSNETVNAYFSKYDNADRKLSSSDCVDHGEFTELFKAGRISALAQSSVQSFRDAIRNDARHQQRVLENTTADDLQRQVEALGGSDKQIIDLIVNAYLNFDTTLGEGVFASRASEMYREHWSYDGLSTSKATLEATAVMLGKPYDKYAGEGLRPKSPSNDVPLYSENPAPYEMTESVPPLQSWDQEIFPR